MLGLTTGPTFGNVRCKRLDQNHLHQVDQLIPSSPYRSSSHWRMWTWPPLGEGLPGIGFIICVPPWSYYTRVHLARVWGESLWWMFRFQWYLIPDHFNSPWCGIPRWNPPMRGATRPSSTLSFLWSLTACRALSTGRPRNSVSVVAFGCDYVIMRVLEMLRKDMFIHGDVFK